MYFGDLTDGFHYLYAYISCKKVLIVFVYSGKEPFMRRVLVTFAVFLSVSALALLVTHRVEAAEVVGRESYTVSWDRPSSAQTFQVYYGQTNTGKKDTTVWGLSSESRQLTLNLLKACTQYSWNVKYLKDGKWSWLWSSDNTFTSGGACSATAAVGKVTTTAGGSKATIVGVGSATATWTVTTAATRYNVYYREAGSQGFTHSVSTGPNTTAVTINHLNPNVTYYYRVGALAGNKEVWQDEKMLKVAVPANPVLGVQYSR